MYTDILKACKSQTVLVNVDDTNKTRFYFDRNSIIEGQIIQAVAFFKDDNVTIAPNGSTVVEDAIAKKAFLTLSIDNEEKLDEIPMALMMPAITGFLYEIEPAVLNLEKSFVQVGNATSLTQNHVFPFVFYYRSQ